MVDHSSYVHDLSSRVKKACFFGLNGIQTLDLANLGAVLYQLSYGARWEMKYCEISYYMICGIGHRR